MGAWKGVDPGWVPGHAAHVSAPAPAGGRGLRFCTLTAPHSPTKAIIAAPGLLQAGPTKRAEAGAHRCKAAPPDAAFWPLQAVRQAVASRKSCSGLRRGRPIQSDQQCARKLRPRKKFPIGEHSLHQQHCKHPREPPPLKHPCTCPEESACAATTPWLASASAQAWSCSSPSAACRPRFPSPASPRPEFPVRRAARPAWGACPVMPSALCPPRLFAALRASH